MDDKFKTSVGLVETAGVSEDEEDDDYGSFMGRTYFDFEDESSLPCLSVKTFLRDCLEHPKILFHKGLDFFRTYLKELKGDLLTLPVDSTFPENHEDNMFYVDKGDKKWLDTLKKRIYSKKDFHWASITPVARKAELGLLVFKWTPAPFSVNFLEAFISYCRTFTEIYLDMTDNDEDGGKVHDVSKAHDYITDFLALFQVGKNMDCEIRNKEAQDADDQRRASNKIEPSTTDLLYLFQKPSKSRTSTARARVSKRQKTLANSNSDESTNDMESSSSKESEYKGNKILYKFPLQIPIIKPSRNVNNERRMRRRQIQTVWVTGATKEACARRQVKLVLERLPLKKKDETSPEAQPLFDSKSLKPATAKFEPGLVTLNGIAGNKIKRTSSPDVITLSSDDELVFPEEKKATVGSPASGGKVFRIRNDKDGICSDAVKRQEPVSNSSTCNSDKKSPQKPMSTFSCDICWFGKFPSQKELKMHMNTAHSKESQIPVDCKYCGMKVKKPVLQFHEEICKKSTRK